MYPDSFKSKGTPGMIWKGSNMLIKTDLEANGSILSAASKKASIDVQETSKIYDFSRNLARNKNLESNKYSYKTSFPSIMSSSKANNPSTFMTRTDDLIPSCKLISS